MDTQEGVKPGESVTPPKKTPKKEVKLKKEAKPKKEVKPETAVTPQDKAPENEPEIEWKGNQSTPPLKIYKKLHAIQGKVEKMEKDGYNDFSKYNYLTETQVTVKMKKLLDEEGVLFMPNWIVEKTEMIGAQFGVIVRIDYKFIDIDSGESVDGYAQGIGADKGDKGIYKAITGGIKYIYMKTFNIPTGDDPEDAKSEKEVAKDAEKTKVQGEQFEKQKVEFKTLLAEFIEKEKAEPNPMPNIMPSIVLEKHTGIKVKALNELTKSQMLLAITKFKRAKCAPNNPITPQDNANQ